MLNKQSTNHEGLKYFNESLRCLQQSYVSVKYLLWLQLLLLQCDGLKSFFVRSFSGPYFSAFGLNTEIYSAYFRIQSECGKMQTRKPPNTNTFHAVCLYVVIVNILFHLIGIVLLSLFELRYQKVDMEH